MGRRGKPKSVSYEKIAEKNLIFAVEKIIKKDDNGYLVKWVGYPDSDNTYCTEDQLEGSARLLR